MENKKCYISGKITSLPYEEALENFAHSEKRVIKMGYESINPMEEVPLNDDWNWHQYMLADIKLLFNCDAIYMQKNWRESKGARIEHSIAVELGLTIIYEV
jgi:hypothetical protein